MPKCPHCNKELTPAQIAALLGSLGKGKTSAAKAKTARENGKRGGRPKGSKTRVLFRVKNPSSN